MVARSDTSPDVPRTNHERAEQRTPPPGRAARQEESPLKGLRELDLARTKMTDAGVKELAALKGLRTLSLWDTAAGDAGVKELAALKGLRRLDIGWTKVTDAGLKELTGLTELDDAARTDALDAARMVPSHAVRFPRGSYRASVVAARSVAHRRNAPRRGDRSRSRAVPPIVSSPCQGSAPTIDATRRSSPGIATAASGRQGDSLEGRGPGRVIPTRLSVIFPLHAPNGCHAAVRPPDQAVAGAGRDAFGGALRLAEGGLPLPFFRPGLAPATGVLPAGSKDHEGRAKERAHDGSGAPGSRSARSSEPEAAPVSAHLCLLSASAAALRTFSEGS